MNQTLNLIHDKLAPQRGYPTIFQEEQLAGVLMFTLKSILLMTSVGMVMVYYNLPGQYKSTLY